jgi:hypothetical protein
MRSILLNQSTGGAVSTHVGPMLNADKINAESTKISQMQQEASQRYTNAMSAATSEMVMGVAASASAAFDVLRSSSVNPFSDALHFASDDLQRAVHKLETAADSAKAAQKDSTDATSDTRDRRKAGLDNIQKILDIIHGMNPQL